MNQTMTSEKFWLGWLKISMILITFAGVVLILINYLGLAAFINKELDKIFFIEKLQNHEAGNWRDWVITISGTVMTGWGLFMLYVVNFPFRKAEKWAWNSIFYPLLIWFLIDTSLSAYYGVGLNILINVVFFLQVTAPLLFFRPQFYNQLSPVS